MDEYHLVRSLLLRIGRGVDASAPLAKALLEWAVPHHAWLGVKAGKDPWKGLLKAAARTDAEAARSHALQLADALGKTLAFETLDARLLTVMVASDRLPRLASLVAIAARHGHDLPTLVGEMAGADEHEAARLVRRSAVLRLGLATFRANRQGAVEVDIGWTLERLLDRAPSLGDEMIDTLVGARQPARLVVGDFGAHPDVDFLVRLLAGAVDAQAVGINILIHGPPGTGKTELARTLAAAAGAVLHGVGEVDEDGAEPNRWERVQALQLAQRLLARAGNTVLLFDEMEDLIGDAGPPQGTGWPAARAARSSSTGCSRAIRCR